MKQSNIDLLLSETMKTHSAVADKQGHKPFVIDNVKTVEQIMLDLDGGHFHTSL